MPTLSFLSDKLSAEVPRGTLVQDAAMDLGASLRLGCRRGSCGTCVVTIVEGAQALAPPDLVERETLLIIGAQPQQRLGCRLRVAADLSLRHDP